MNRQETRDVRDARCAESTKKSSFLGALGLLGALALLFEPARPERCCQATVTFDPLTTVKLTPSLRPLCHLADAAFPPSSPAFFFCFSL